MTGPRPFFGENNDGGLFRLSLWISLPNFTFVTLPVPEIGGTLKILGVTWQGHAKFLKKKLFHSVSLVHAKMCAKFLVYSFIRSKVITPNRMHVFACKMPEMHPKIVFLGVQCMKIWHLNVETALGNQSPAKHVIWCKNDGDMSLCLFSRAWQEIT